MKASTVGAATCVVMFLLLLPFSARSEQGQVKVSGQLAPAAPRPAMGATANSIGGGSGSVAATGVATPSGYYSPGVSAPVGAPNLRGTSFGTIGAYYSWNSYYNYLSTNYNVSPIYFSRFYRNTEPLITPDILKLTLRTPILLGARMMNSIDQLEVMFKEVESEATIDGKVLREKSKTIRKLAKQIRNNKTLSIVDLREKTDLYQRNKHDSFDPESLTKLREMAFNLNLQLRKMYNQPSTAVISIDSYSEPSLESLAKGIEEICKDIEKFSKQM
jgi:hypothetical protein